MNPQNVEQDQVEETWDSCPKCGNYRSSVNGCGACKYDAWVQDLINNTTDTITENLETSELIHLYAYYRNLTEALETCQEEAARVRREALLEAAKAVCKPCENNAEIVFEKGHYRHPHRNGWVWCDAEGIHKLLADQGNEG